MYYLPYLNLLIFLFQLIDFLFFVHDRHDGNMDAARCYLKWETGLLAQLDDQERGILHPPQPNSTL